MNFLMFIYTRVKENNFIENIYLIIFWKNYYIYGGNSTYLSLDMYLLRKNKPMLELKDWMLIVIGQYLNKFLLVIGKKCNNFFVISQLFPVFQGIPYKRFSHLKIKE